MTHTLRPLARIALGVVVTLLAGACARRSMNTVELPLKPAAAPGGTQPPQPPAASPGPAARMKVPKDWRPLVGSASRVEFLGPDNRSRTYLRLMPSETDVRGCPQAAEKYATEVIDSWGGPPRTQVAARHANGDTVNFELRRQDPKPQGEIIWARVVCRHGVLAIASCTVSTPREQELAPVCRQVVESLEVVSAEERS